MKRAAMVMMVMATGIMLGSAAYAQGTHNAPKPEAGASQKHDEHCCKPDPSDMKGMQGMTEHSHDQAQVPKKPAAKKPARKPVADVDPTAK